MSNPDGVKPYLVRIKDWKIKNMVMLYLEARGRFKEFNRMLRKGNFPSFERLREISEMLFEIKEDHHLLFKRLLDPQKHRFEKADKFTPNHLEIEFMNNIGLLFHKVTVARELKYVMEHYVEQSETFQRTKENLKLNIARIDELFDEGIEILTALISEYRNNVLLLAFLLENSEKVKRQFGCSCVDLISGASGVGRDDLYFKVGSHYSVSGHKDRAKEMFRKALKENAAHSPARERLKELA